MIWSKYVLYDFFKFFKSFNAITFKSFSFNSLKTKTEQKFHWKKLKEIKGIQI